MYLLKYHTGLTGQAYNTWWHKECNVYWPKDLLSNDLPSCRILTFGYDADIIHIWKQKSTARLGNHAEALVGDLARQRIDTDSNDRPILFIVHSLGGLVTENALCYSRNHSAEHLQKVCHSALLTIQLENSSCRVCTFFRSLPFEKLE